MKKTLFLFFLLVFTIPSSLIFAGNLVNNFEGTTPTQSSVGVGPPTDSYNDCMAWVGVAVFPTPVPSFWPYYQLAAANPGNPLYVDAGAPTGPAHGKDMMRAT